MTAQGNALGNDRRPIFAREHGHLDARPALTMTSMGGSVRCIALLGDIRGDQGFRHLQGPQPVSLERVLGGSRCEPGLRIAGLSDQRGERLEGCLHVGWRERTGRILIDQRQGDAKGVDVVPQHPVLPRAG